MMDRMPFGKHKGVLLRDLPADYVTWLRCNTKLYEPLATELERRFGGKFKRKHDAPPEEPHEFDWTAGSLKIIRAARRRWAAVMHPDADGSLEAMKVANRIFDDLEKRFKAE